MIWIYGWLWWLVPMAIVSAIASLAFRRPREARPALIAQWQAMDNRQRLSAIAIIAGIIGFAWLLNQQQTSHRQHILREQLHLPDDAHFTAFYSAKKVWRRPRIDGIVQFTDDSFRQYAQSLGDAAVWQPVPLAYDGQNMAGPHDARALQWSRDALPRLAGQRPVQIGNISQQAVQALRGAPNLCLAIVKTISNGATAEAGSARYSGHPCRAVSHEVDPAAVLIGILDEKRKQLHMSLY